MRDKTASLLTREVRCPSCGSRGYNYNSLAADFKNGEVILPAKCGKCKTQFTIVYRVAEIRFSANGKEMQKVVA
jgi:transcription elongation factor Elf1